MVDYAFSHSRWLRIFANIYEHNLASMRTLEKNGFAREAIHKKTVIKEGKLLDEHLFAIRKEQWLAHGRGSSDS
jgi:RimJ/RimL family protein N-acetyltransferase